MEQSTWQTILVIGASDATGGAIAKRFPKEGYIECVTRRTADKLQPRIDEIRAEGGEARPRLRRAQGRPRNGEGHAATGARHHHLYGRNGKFARTRRSRCIRRRKAWPADWATRDAGRRDRAAARDGDALRPGRVNRRFQLRFHSLVLSQRFAGFDRRTETNLGTRSQHISQVRRGAGSLAGCRFPLVIG